MNKLEFDIIIVGAGPAGCACALSLPDSAEIKIAVIDKEIFPRDKICGDALSSDVVNQLQKLPGSIGTDFAAFKQKKESFGVRFYSPDLEKLDIPFPSKPNHFAPGYLSKRIDFDNALVEQLKKRNNIFLLEGEKINSIDKTDDRVIVNCTSGILRGKIIVGADGAHSLVAKSFGLYKVEKDHYCAGLRAYYQNVNGFHQENFIELHFYKEFLPGYFWIFQLPGNMANVGIGMLSSTVSKKKINLKLKMQQIISSHPNVASRFKDAVLVDAIRGYGLPIGSKKRSISSDRCLLVGDAASLIDPFSGEGIGNAIRSGRIAASHIIKCMAEENYTAEFNRAYDKLIYKKMWKELRLSRKMQQLLNFPSLFNFIVRKANQHTLLQSLLAHMFVNIDLKSKLLRPSFYIKLLTLKSKNTSA